MKSQKTVWIGPRNIDIEAIQGHFYGEIVYASGTSNSLNVSYSLEDKLGVRINYNSDEKGEVIDEFIAESALEIISEQPDVEFLWYRPPGPNCHTDILRRSPFNPPLSLIPLINNKIHMRLMMTPHAAPIPITLLPQKDCTYKKLTQRFPDFDSFVLQIETGSGGFQTLLVRSEKDDQNVMALDVSALLASGFMDQAIPINIHIIVSDDDVLVLPPSIQIIESGRNGHMLFSGSDYGAVKHLDKDALEAIHRSARSIGKTLSQLGYRGVAGIDFLLSEGQVLFVEINPRFQASTFLLNEALVANGQPSVHELHMRAVCSEAVGRLDACVCDASFVIRHTDAPEGLFSNEGAFQKKSPDSWKSLQNQERVHYRVKTDLKAPDTVIEKGGQKGRVIFNHSVLGFTHTSPPQLLPSLKSHFQPGPVQVIDPGSITDLAQLKFTLFASGARVSQPALDRLYGDRATLTMRDGIAGGLEIVLPKSVHVNVPIKERYAQISPNSIDLDDQGRFILRHHKQDILINIMPQPSFAGQLTRSGMPMEAVGQIFTDRLSIYPFRGCLYNKERGIGCAFCEVAEFGAPQKTARDDIIDLIRFCRNDKGINMRHILLSGGVPPVHQWDYYLELIMAIRSETDLPLYQMIVPPNDLSFLNELYQAGVNEIGFNMEIVDPTLSRTVMPGKGKIDRNTYIRAMEYAVNLWGNDAGQVRSALIVGLEPISKTLEGVELFASRGVMPILSPFRPVPTTPMAHFAPAGPELMMEAWKRGKDTAARYNQVLGPTCIGCQNNTISMPEGPRYRYY